MKEALKYQINIRKTAINAAKKCLPNNFYITNKKTEEYYSTLNGNLVNISGIQRNLIRFN